MEAEIVVPKEETPNLPAVANPATGLMSIIGALAANPSVDIDKLQRLIDMQVQREEALEKKEALNAFNQAFSDFKAEAAVIVKNVQVKDGPLKEKWYADKFGVCSAIIPALAKHGLSHSWKLTKDDKDWMEVTCTLRHSMGHSETNAMGGAPDTGPGRNAIQARSSTNSYLERITLLAITGMAAKEEDDDGNGGNQRTAMENVVADIEACKTLADLQSTFQTAYMLAARRPESQKAFKAAYESRKAALAKEAK